MTSKQREIKKLPVEKNPIGINEHQKVAIVAFILGVVLIAIIFLLEVFFHISEFSTYNVIFFIIEHAAASLIIVGIVAWIFETYFRHEMLTQVEGKFQKQFNEFCYNLQENVNKRVNPGIVEIATKRDNHKSYTKWISSESEDVFFAGRAVLARINKNLESSNLSGVVPTLIEKYKTGSRIRIVTFDPRSDLIKRIADDETRSYEEILNDIVESIGLVYLLYEESKKIDFKNEDGSIIIVLYDLINDFSYQEVKRREGSNKANQMLFGMYYNYQAGYNTPLYEVLDPQTKKFFSTYIKKIYDVNHPCRWLLRIENGKRPSFNKDLYKSIENHIERTCIEHQIELIYKLPKLQA